MLLFEYAVEISGDACYGGDVSRFPCIKWMWTKRIYVVGGL